MEKIKTNYGNLTEKEIIDHLAYISYKTQRDLGCSYELLKKWFANSDEFEKIYNAKSN